MSKLIEEVHLKKVEVWVVAERIWYWKELNSPKNKTKYLNQLIIIKITSKYATNNGSKTKAH